MKPELYAVYAALLKKYSPMLTGFVVGDPDKGEMPVTVLNLYVVEG